MDLVSLFVIIVVFGILFYLVQSVLPLPPPFRMAALVILCLILILVLLSSIGYLGGGEFYHRPLVR